MVQGKKEKGWAAVTDLGMAAHPARGIKVRMHVQAEEYGPDLKEDRCPFREDCRKEGFAILFARRLLSSI
jgi:hypothetical protein